MASSLSSNSFALLLIACKQATVRPRYEMRPQNISRQTWRSRSVVDTFFKDFWSLLSCHWNTSKYLHVCSWLKQLFTFPCTAFSTSVCCSLASLFSLAMSSGSLLHKTLRKCSTKLLAEHIIKYLVSQVLRDVTTHQFFFDVCTSMYETCKVLGKRKFMLKALN